MSFADLPLDDIRRVAGVFGGTTNDIVLAATAGALRTFFAARGEEPDTSLVALVPVSVRTEAEQGALGNRVSAMLVSLATGVADPVARLGRIREGMAAAKEQSRAVGPDVYSAWAEAAFPAVATRLSRLVTNLRVFDHVAPLFNLVVSNVPGPGRPALPGRRPDDLAAPHRPDHGGRRGQRHRLLLPGLRARGDPGVLGPGARRGVLGRAMEASLAELVAEAERRDRPVPWWHAELPA